MHLNIGSNELEQASKSIEELLKQFKSEERLSDFERGQADALRWALDVIEEIKNPPQHESFATGGNI
jgi:hypothetical protein